MLTAKAIFTEQALDAAYDWLCKQRQHFPPNADVWALRFKWPTVRLALMQSLVSETYTLSPQTVVTNAQGETLHLWNARDALVLKVLSQGVTEPLGIAPQCTHIKGHGGLKATINQVQTRIPDYHYVMKTDVKHYYESICHDTLLRQLSEVIDDPFIWRLLFNYIKRAVDYGGNIRIIQRGISRGCALSPVLAAFYLAPCDHAISQTPCVHYLRYMDDLIVLTKTRWSLRRMVRKVNTHFNRLSLTQAKDKTLIGKIEKGFDFSGYHFSRGKLALADKMMSNMRCQWQRLYEQKKTACPKGEHAVILARYWQRWSRWAKGGLSDESKKAITQQIDALYDLSIRDRVNLT